MKTTESQSPEVHSSGWLLDDHFPSKEESQGLHYQTSTPNYPCREKEVHGKRFFISHPRRPLILLPVILSSLAGLLLDMFPHFFMTFSHIVWLICSLMLLWSGQKIQRGKIKKRTRPWGGQQSYMTHKGLVNLMKEQNPGWASTTQLQTISATAHSSFNLPAL